jgi:hypothetical protein
MVPHPLPTLLFECDFDPQAAENGAYRFQAHFLFPQLLLVLVEAITCTWQGQRRERISQAFSNRLRGSCLGSGDSSNYRILPNPLHFRCG